jgi:hypothetical protein
MAHGPQLDEPKTPMWLPALGGALFLALGIWWIARPAEPPPESAEPTTAAAAVDAGAGEAAAH